MFLLGRPALRDPHRGSNVQPFRSQRAPLVGENERLSAGVNATSGVSLSGHDVDDDDLRAVASELVAAVVLGASGVCHQADEEGCARRDEDQFNRTPHFSLPSS